MLPRTAPPPKSSSPWPAHAHQCTHAERSAQGRGGSEEENDGAQVRNEGVEKTGDTQRGKRPSKRSGCTSDRSSCEKQQAQERVSQEEGKARRSSRSGVHPSDVQQHDHYSHRPGWPRGKLVFGRFGGL